MPKLTRYLQKIFANNSNQVGVFGTGVDKETSKNVETLQSADYENGWSSAIITNKNYPIWQEMDGVQYGLSYQIKYLQQAGIPEWLSTETYYANTSFCQYGGKIYQSLQDNNIGHNPALDDGYWTPLLTSSRSIGEIISSTIPLTEAGLHLLDGSLITNGMYADFVTYMVNLTATAPECFCTEAEWQQSVNTYGVCGKFVYDSVNNTIRLPKYSNKIYTQDINATAPVVGNGVAIGVSNGTTLAGLGSSAGGLVTPAVSNYGVPIGSATGSPYIVNTTIGLTTDATKSGIIAQLSDITTSLDGYYYIVVATSTKTNIQVDIDEIATDLNGKADIDLSNTSLTSAFAGKLNTAGIVTIVETYVNGLSGYNVYSNNLCEQWGYVATNGVAGLSTVTFLKAYGDTNYNILTCPQRGDLSYAPIAIPMVVNTGSMQVGSTVYTGGYYWRTIGYTS